MNKEISWRQFRAYYALVMYGIAIFVAISSAQMKATIPTYTGTWDTFAIWYAVILATALLAYNGATYKKYLATLA